MRLIFVPSYSALSNKLNIFIFFKQIKYLGKEKGDDDQNRIKYETCKERDSCKLCVHNTTQHNTTQHEMKNFKNN